MTEKSDGRIDGESCNCCPDPSEDFLLNFGGALNVLRHGNKITRKGWNGKGMWLRMQEPDTSSKMTLPYIYMKTAQGDLVPWLASQSDILAEDWEVPCESNG